MKYRLKDGEGIFPSDCPLQDCSVRVHYKARSWIPSNPNSSSLPWTYDSKLEHSGEPYNVDLGTAILFVALKRLFLGCGQLPFGLEACIHLMLPKEISRVECKADAAYKNVNTRCKPPSGMNIDEDVEFEVELVSFEKGLQWGGMGGSIETALKEAQKMKSLANDLYKERAVKLAENKYQLVGFFFCDFGRGCRF